jgi:hypothetical protein
MSKVLHHGNHITDEYWRLNMCQATVLVVDSCTEQKRLHIHLHGAQIQVGKMDF